MKYLVFAILLVMASTAVGAEHVLQSPVLRVVVDLETGGIAQCYDLRRPDSSSVFGADEDILAVAAGDFRPFGFMVTGSDSTSITMVSSVLVREANYLPLRTTITYRLAGHRLGVDYCFEALERLELLEGLDINITSSVWDSLVTRNHFSGERTIEFGPWNVWRYRALNQVYELENAFRNLSLVFANPYHSLITIETRAPHALHFTWHVLAAHETFQAVDPVGPPFASVLSPGVQLYRQIELVVTHRDTTPVTPIAYFSPFPNGYDQVIAMTFDDIPFRGWLYPESGHDPNAPMQQYLVRLMEEHPKMKMGWIVLPDAIWSEAEIQNPDYPRGEWWLAHGPRRILTAAPEDFIQWVRNVERDSLVYGYEDRVHLGSHGYHHTPELVVTKANFEFQYYDPAFNDSTFSTIVREYNLLGLGTRSHKWIRFPGFHFTRATIESLIKYGFILFDYWEIYDKLPWMLFYSEHGRIWGVGTKWEGDTPAPYEVMDKILGAGKLCHTAGHPYAWFDNGSETAYQQIHQTFEQAETDYPNLGYMFPDDVGYFADETYDIRDIQTEIACDALVFSFVGSATLGQTIVVEWPNGFDLPTAATVDGLDAPPIETRERRCLISLPELEDGPHVVRVDAVLGDSCETYVPPPGFALFQNYPNPFVPFSTIAFELSEPADVSLRIYDVSGRLVRVLTEGRRTADRHEEVWDGRDDEGRRVASGVYFYRLCAGTFVQSRKMVLVR